MLILYILVNLWGGGVIQDDRPTPTPPALESGRRRQTIVVSEESCLARETKTIAL